MARPSSVPRWDSTVVNLVVPPSGQLDTGWTVGQVPPSSYDNWYKNLVYQWINWIQAGVLDGTWEFTGAVRFDSTVDIYDVAVAHRARLVGPASIPSNYTLTLPTATPASPAILQSDASGNLTFSNTFTQAIVAPDFKNNVAKAISLPASVADLNSNQRVLGAAGVKMIILSGGNAITFPVNLHTNDQITGYSVYILKNSNNSNTVSARLYTTDGAGNETAQGAGSSNNGNADGAHVIGESGLTVTISPQAYLAVSSTATTDNVVCAAVSYVRP